ncbi:VirB4-like conjugal transfer ATPase, CD1110 family [Clostridium akagii]|uniref:VirB4-like conjugal transfer ATPase, CD1110 family n=1 Tax=Clostridium akagii TaxID=91623 RepID=UPI00068CFEB1|nr:ATP-binding protein [Clostridium akagii]
MFLKKEDRSDSKKIEFKNENDSDSDSKTRLQKIKIPHSVQDTIPFEELYSNGMYKVEDGLYSIMLKFSNINYRLSREDEQKRKYKLYSAVLNSLAPDIHYQELIMNRTIEGETYRNCLLPKDNKYKELPIHKDYIKVQEYFIDESYNATSDKKTYIALSYRVKSKAESAYQILKKSYKNIAIALKKLDSNCIMLKPLESLEILYNYYNPLKSKEDKFVLPKNIYSIGRKVKDYIAPSSFKFKTSLIEMGTAYTRIFFVKDYPETLDDVFISDLMDNSYDICVTKHVDHIEKGSALQFLKKKRTTLEGQRQDRKKKNKREGMDYIPLELQDAIDETNEMLEKLKSDQDYFLVGFYISISADSMERLDDISRDINTICRQHMVILDVVTHRQEQALASMLPLGNDKVNVSRRMTTDAAAILLPFNAQNIFDETGFYYGRNSFTNSMVVIDRKKLKNGNGFILGVPGAGKSLKSKREIIDVLELTNDDVIIIDPEREFNIVCEKYNGELIKISANTNTHMNPMDISMDYADDDDPIQAKSDFILSIVETIKGELSATEKTIVDRCVRLSYKKFIDSGWNQEYIPTFVDFYEILKIQNEIQAKDITLALELYVIGSLNTFSHKSNVSLTNRLTVLDTKDLGKNLKKVGLLIVLDSVWNILCANKEKGKNTWVITDEFYLYFDDRDNKESYSAEYYYQIYKRARKYGGLITGITQNVEDLLQSPKARTMLANSQFIVLLDQAPTDRAVVKKLLNLSETQENFITNAEQGCGLLVVGKDIIPFEDEYPKGNEVYKAITTKIDEIREYKLQEEALNKNKKV